jgi:hypothetical protein
MAQNDLRAVAFPKLDGDVRSRSVKRVASAVGRRSNGGLLRARVLEGHVNDAQSPTWPPRENHPDAAYHECRE